AMMPYDWAISHSESPKDMTSHAAEDGHRIGVLILDANVARYQRSLEELICRKKMCWLGILDRSLLAHPDIRQFIHQTLYAYQTLPLDPQKTNALLESALDMVAISP
ncbi:VpsR-related response regulator, partial [Staphylococcus aureus]|uniref:VpsR-related response regulator n=1 Tax=Staphylococcus aureus TaxID=1280 RepID=UPI00301E4828